MTDTTRPRKKRPGSEPDKDIFLTLLHAPDRQSLSRLIKEYQLDVGPVRPQPDSTELEVHLYADMKQIEKLKKTGWKLEIRENLTETGKLRQKEVGQGDRFQGGKIPPKGRGTKKAKEC